MQKFGQTLSDLFPYLLVAGLTDVALLIGEVINQQNNISWLHGHYHPTVCKCIAA